MGRVWNPDRLVGTRLGSCVLQRPLGEGGMGAVYLAQQERPRRQVAVKVLRPQLSNNAAAWPVFLARFRREADATAALDHGNIVPIYEFGEQDGIAYLVMPYLPDGSLANVLTREGALPPDRALAYLAQAAAALDYAHEHGIVHRDVKPSNLLLHPDGRLLLADFGIARPLERRELAKSRVGGFLEAGDEEDDSPTLTREGAVLGTPQYMAPEQIRGEAVGPATDIYALGAVAYTLLAGRAPFGEGTPGEVLRRQLLGQPVPLRTVRPDLPPRAEGVILQALAVDPAERPRTATAFVQGLRVALRNRTLGEIVASNTREAPAARAGAVATSALRPLAEVGERPMFEAPTIFDGPPYGVARQQPGGVPQWPGGGGDDAGGPGGGWPGGRRPAGRRGWLLGVAAVLVSVLLCAGLLSTLAQSQIGGTVLGNQPRATATATQLPTPTATPKPTPTPTPPANWLTVRPSSVNLGCRKSSRSERVILKNIGPDEVSWFATYSEFFGGISVSPTDGRLDRGESVSITITNTSTFIGHSGTISFTPTDGQAGQAATVSYTTVAC